MSKPRLHLDADTAVRALERELLARGHDVTRTPTGWMPADAGDEMQLLRATARGRVLFTFNIRDFIVLAEQYPQHAGILLAAQRFSYIIPIRHSGSVIHIDGLPPTCMELLHVI